MPSPVDKYFEQVKEQNPSYSDEQAWATAWSIYCKHKNPGSDHCHKPAGEYLKGKNASELGLVVRVASRFMEAAGPEIPIEPRIWNALTGNQRIQVAKESGALKEWTTLRQLRACHAYIRENLDKFKNIKIDEA
jgi:hypothetical protein